MIQTIEKPEEFNHLPDNCSWISLNNGAGLIAYLGIQRINTESAAIHMHVLRWSHNVLKTLKIDWQAIVKALHGDGVRYLIAANDDIGDTRWPKFIKYFGFPEPKLTKYSKQELKKWDQQLGQ